MANRVDSSGGNIQIGNENTQTIKKESEAAERNMLEQNEARNQLNATTGYVNASKAASEAMKGVW